MHGGNAKSHKDPAENEAKRRCALATDDVKAAAGYENRHYERKGSQSDVIGHRYRHGEGEHGDEVHRPYPASHYDRGRHQPHATRKCPGGRHAPAKIKGGVRREGGDQNGKSDEIRIVRSGNDHQDPPNLDERPVGDASVDAPGSVLQSASRSHRLDRGYELWHGRVPRFTARVAAAPRTSPQKQDKINLV